MKNIAATPARQVVLGLGSLYVLSDLISLESRAGWKWSPRDGLLHFDGSCTPGS